MIDKLKQKYALLRERKILQCRSSFWEFQKITDPTNYKDERTYLLILALSLQSYYENKVCSYTSKLKPEYHGRLDLSDTTIDVQIEPHEKGSLITVDCSETDILIIEVPPRHHKSHSLIMFECWCFGQNPKTIMVTAAHNSRLANEFSQYVRDGIEEVRLKSTSIIYSDVFPYTRMKFGDRSKEKWALHGSFLSYTGSGIFTPVTGKGGNMIVFDDPIKGPLEAFNENHLDKIWTSYTDGWLSRMESPRRQVLVMTPWIQGDIADRITEGAEDSGEVVKVFNCKAFTENQGMLCEEILNKRTFDILRSRLDPIIFSGNYLCTRLGKSGLLYPSFNYYTKEDLPKKFDEIYGYTDTADEGKDFLSSGIVGIIRSKDEFGLRIKKAYMLAVYYTQEGMEITEKAMVEFLIKNNIQGNMIVDVESNNGGRGFARIIKKELSNRKDGRGIIIKWFHQSENKDARINSESNTIMKYFYFPVDWQTRDKYWAAYSKSMLKYSKDGDNTHDDAQDMTTGIAEKKINTDLSMLDAIANRRR